MRPEDIDKLFREKLDQHVTPPPPGLWFDLQERIEPKEEKRRAGFWMYAVAAAITLLLVAGTGWLVWRPTQLSQSPVLGELATVSPPQTGVADQTQGSVSEEALAQPDALAANTPSASSEETAAPAADTNRSTPAQTTDSFTPTPEAARQRDAIRMVARTKRGAPAPEQRPALRPTPQPEEAVAAVKPAAAPAPELLATSPAPVPAGSQALAATGLPKAPQGAIEVEVRESAANLPVVATAGVEPEASRRSRLFGVVKQVSRVVRGEKPDLTEVGLPSNPALTVQARLGSHTLTKTISL
ncbi:hypothetical protein [Hymenobacter koreensis]|uniref:Uncharacterized protein n=1 Tax=Hymenobacter koreensis TaxID=1084523 RepID=A0ABP8J6X6_9BACT